MDQNIYVLIPGITGSVLQKDGRDIFGLTAQAGLRALFSAGETIKDLRLADDPPDVDDLGDGIKPSRVASDAHLIPGLWKIDGYSRIVSYLTQRMRLKPGVDYFEFPYDWRRDNRVAAHRLAAQSKAWLQDRPDARLVLVAHSMGGLVARYYLEALGGWRNTRTLITFGTPYRGSLKALDFLVNGMSRLLGLFDVSDVARSFTSIYQLLPIYRCLDRGDRNLVRLTEAPGLLPHLDHTRVLAARAFHREIEDAVHRNQDDPQYRERGYETRLVVGTEQPTSQSASWEADRLTVLRTYEGIDLAGDGTVPRVSAFPQEAANDAYTMYAAARHATLHNSEGVLTQIRNWMSAVDLTSSSFRAGAPVSLSLDLNDVYPAGVPVCATVQPSTATGDLQATLEWVAGPSLQTTTILTLPPKDGPRPIQFPPSKPGCYRLVIAGADEVEPVSDLLVVPGDLA